MINLKDESQVASISLVDKEKEPEEVENSDVINNSNVETQQPVELGNNSEEVIADNQEINDETLDDTNEESTAESENDEI